MQLAANNGFEVVQKSVKYIHDNREVSGLKKKCDLDVEMAVDLVRLHDAFDHIVTFSGDGDLAYAFQHLHRTYGITISVIAARGHIGKELVTAKQSGFVQHLLFADDFENRLDKTRR